MYNGNIAGRVVRTFEGKLPYKVVLTHSACSRTEHSFPTMREAEAFIRRSTPALAPALSTLYDRGPDET